MPSLLRNVAVPTRVLVIVLASLAGAGVVAIGASMFGVFGSGTQVTAVRTGWVYEGVLATCAAVVFARAIAIRADRLGWSLIGAGLLAWLSADLVWFTRFSDAGAVPYPSIADGLYLMFYPLVSVGVMAVVRGHLRGVRTSQWLDGLAACLMLAALGCVVLIPALAGWTDGDLATIATNLAYPLGDFLILSLIVVVAGLIPQVSGRGIWLLAGAALIFAGADTAFLMEVAAGSYVEGHLLDWFWPIAFALIAAAAWQPSMRTQSVRTPVGLVRLVLPAVVAGAGLVAVVLAGDSISARVGSWLAVACILVCFARAGFTFQENLALTRSHHLQATTDVLTGLPNRRLFTELADRMVAQARRDGRSMALMIIDLDHFKEVNDTLGHRYGDDLLRAIAANLKGAVRESDTVARLGGDEFAVILPAPADALGSRAVAEKLLVATNRPVQLGDLSITPEASVGIALFPDHGDDVDELLQRADVAMYAAKQGYHGYMMYEADHDPNTRDELALVSELRTGLKDGQLVLHFQPKVDLRDGTIAGAEALVRWNHPRRGLLMPGEFVARAEETMLIVDLTFQVLDMALAQCASWAAAGTPLAISVNISPRCLREVDFAQQVAERLARWGIAPEWLELELTEGVVIAGTAREQEVLNELDRLGVALVIDDFGTGYSSLARLRDLPMSILKIDQSFIRNLRFSPPDAVIVQATIDLARSLGVELVAEGIEDGATADVLMALGCNFGQGYHLGRPMEIDRFDAFVAGARERQAAALLKAHAAANSGLLAELPA